jgi:hypothetical protein
MRDPSAPVREGGFSEGLAPARFGDRYGYLDAAGRTAVTPRFDHAGPFSGGRAPVLVDGLWGYASRDGALAIAPAFDWAGAFSEGRAAVSRDGAYRFIDTAGDSLGHSVFSEARPFSGGLAAVRFGHGEDAAWGFVDLRGRLAIPPLFPEAPRGFREGYAAVAVGSDAGRRMGYIDSSGGFAMDSLFEAAGDFSGGLAPVGRGEIAAGRFVGTWHYIDRAGKPAFPGRFAWAGAFEGDYALAKGLDGGFLRIDRRGMEAGKVPDSLVAGPRRQGFTVTYELRNAHGVGPSGGLPAATE